MTIIPIREQEIIFIEMWLEHIPYDRQRDFKATLASLLDLAKGHGTLEGMRAMKEIWENVNSKRANPQEEK